MNLVAGSNDSHEEVRKFLHLERTVFPKWDDDHLLKVTIAIGALIIILNTFIIALFLRFRVLRSKPNIFPVNLTVSDLTVGVLVIPVFVVSESSTITTDTYIFLRRIHHLSSVLLVFNSLVSIYSLAAVIVDRAVSVCFPLKHLVHFTARKAALSVSTIWLLSTVFAGTSFAIYKPLYDYHSVGNTTQLLAFSKQLLQHLENYKFYDDVFISLCFVGTSTSGLALLAMCIVVRNGRRRKRQRISVARQQRLIEESKTSLMLGLMFAGVLVWIVAIAYLHRSDLHREKYVGMNLGRFVLSVVNPIVYTLMKHDVHEKAKDDVLRAKKAVQFVLRKLRCSETKSSEHEGNTKDVELQTIKNHTAQKKVAAATKS